MPTLELSNPAALPADWRDFVALTKPRVMSLVVFSGLCGLLIAPVQLPLVLGFTAILCIAMGAGATSTSHVNDAGYWLVSRYFGISEKDTLKSWTVLETIMGFTAFGVAALLSLIV